MSEDRTGIVIGSLGGQHATIRPLWRCHPGQLDYWDGNWIESDVSIAAGAFHGRFRASLRSEEFGAFRNQLRVLADTLRGTASFATMEEQVTITLQGDGKGHVAVNGHVLD